MNRLQGRAPGHAVDPATSATTAIAARSNFFNVLTLLEKLFEARFPADRPSFAKYRNPKKRLTWFEHGR